MVRDLVEKNRSYRRFYEEKKIDRGELAELIEIARLTPSAANRQANRFMIVNTEKENALVFSCLRWAGYYKDWDGPVEGERPAAYVIMLAPENVNVMHDEGIKAQTILLAAVEQGMGGCMIGNIDRQKMASVLEIPEGYVVSLVIALGYPKENVMLHDIGAEDDIKYYRDEEQNQHVPKIKAKDLIL